MYGQTLLYGIGLCTKEQRLSKKPPVSPVRWTNQRKERRNDSLLPCHVPGKVGEVNIKARRWCVRFADGQVYMSEALGLPVIYETKRAAQMFAKCKNESVFQVEITIKEIKKRKPNETK